MRTAGRTKENTFQRLYGLLALQKEIESQFGNTNYNIFVFGSYPTVHYIDGESDIDIAVYTKDFELYKKMSLYLEEYFQRAGIKSDIFFVDTSLIAPVFSAALNAQIQFTDYFPEELQAFKEKCDASLWQMKEKLAV